MRADGAYCGTTGEEPHDRVGRTAVHPRRRAVLRGEQDPGRDRVDPRASPAGRSAGCSPRPRPTASSASRSCTPAPAGCPSSAGCARRLRPHRRHRRVLRRRRNDEELQSRTAQAAADYLAALRPDPAHARASAGAARSHDVSLHLKHGWAPGVDVVQINGGVSLNRRAGTAATTAVTIAQKAFGSAPPCCRARPSSNGWRPSAPSSPTAPSPPCSNWRRAPTPTCTAPGRPTQNSALVDSGYLTPDDVAELVRKGAVGDIVGRYIDAVGNIVDAALDERTLGLQLEQLRAAQLSHRRHRGQQPSTPSRGRRRQRAVHRARHRRRHRPALLDEEP